MSLIKSNSREAFEQNLRTLIDEGKPRNQALAIAYDIQRRSGRNYTITAKYKDYSGKISLAIKVIHVKSKDEAKIEAQKYVEELGEHVEVVSFEVSR